MRYHQFSFRGVSLVLAAAIFASSPVAFAFFPIGGYDVFGTLRFARYPLAEFDNNNDGSVDGDEGLEIVIEGGPRGFTDEEIQEVLAALQTWEDVPTSFAAFGQISITQDTLPTEPDFITSIRMQVGDTGVLGENQDIDDVNDLTDDVLGLTTTLYTAEDTIVEGFNEGTIVPAGTILDNDLIISAAAHRVLVGQETPQAEIQASVTHGIGRMLGLGSTPLNNLREVTVGEDEIFATLVESEPLGLTGASGEQQRIGATPTMFPAYFFVEDFETGEFRGGWSDLAPDDISGISWLYPRGDQDADYFTISQEARTTRRDGSAVPSFPISGGHVVAWADVDDDEATPRIPLFSTISGLFVPPQDENLWGRFELLGLWKQLEIPGTQNTVFTPTYSLSLNAFNGTGLSRQAPTEENGTLASTADEVDSISGSNSFLTVEGGLSETKEYNEIFISEVFNETQNITDVSNKDAGTPLVWNFERNTVISADTGRTIPEMLPGAESMFGDPNDVCPLNIISGGGTGTTGTGTGTGTDTGTDPGLGAGVQLDEDSGIAFASIGGGGGMSGPEQLRWLRDAVLMNTTLGTMLVDTYYTYAPYAARFMLRHTEVIAPMAFGVGLLYWLAANPLMIVGGLAAALAAGVLLRRRSRKAAAAVLMLSVLLGASTAQAQILPVSDERMVSQSDLIVVGRVIAADGRQEGVGGRIFTDVALEVDQIVKLPTEEALEGEVTDGGIIVEPPEVPDVGDILNFTVFGGRVNGVVLDVEPLPFFNEGDYVLLFFIIDGDEWVLYNGDRGKFDVEEDSKGEAQVKATNPYALAGLYEAASKYEKTADAAPSDEEVRSRLPLDFYVKYLRNLAEQSR